MNGAGPGQGRRLLDEALRLLDLAQATRPGGYVTGTGTGTGTGAGTGGDGRYAPAGGECCICPVCRGIAYLRQVDPQAVERLTGAVSDVATAVRDLVGAPTAPQSQSQQPGTAGDGPGTGDGSQGGAVPRVSVQKIDVTD